MRLEKLIGSGHPFGFSVRLILFVVGTAGAIFGYSSGLFNLVSASAGQLSGGIFECYDWVDHRGASSLAAVALASVLVVHYRGFSRQLDREKADIRKSLRDAHEEELAALNAEIAAFREEISKYKTIILTESSSD
jgi:hypothetical protein